MTAVGRHCDQPRQREDISRQRRQCGDAHANGRLLAPFFDLLALPCLLLRLARPARQLRDHILREARRNAGPSLGKQVEKNSFSGRYQIDLDLAGKGDPHRHAIRIVARRTDVVGCLDVQPVDGNRNRLLETHHQDAVGNLRGRPNLTAELEDEPGIAIAGGHADIAWHRRSCSGGCVRQSNSQPRRHDQPQQHAGGVREHTPMRTRAGHWYRSHFRRHTPPDRTQPGQHTYAGLQQGSGWALPSR